ncbi:MAG: Hsp20/alpha crystallin family protein [Planctomycetaceae bacterium]|nr:Hsp20/alpha crystallin family protein [Planctomycetaceae bacterium]
MLVPLVPPRVRAIAADPFTSLRRELDKAFEETFGSAANAAWMPSLSVRETDSNVRVMVDVPGLTEQDLEVSYDKGRLWIRGERRPLDGDGQCWHEERVYGRFERSFALPDTIDPTTISATLNGGILSLTVGKKSEARPMRIAIQGAQNGSKCLEGNGHSS